MFRAADLVLLTKSDLLPVLDDFDPVRAEAYLRNLASRAPFISLSSRKNLNLQGWLEWLRLELAQRREHLRPVTAPRKPMGNRMR